MADLAAILTDIERICIADGIPMLGRAKAEFLAAQVREAQPQLVVECGTAIGYSGLWIASELQQAGSGRLITVEIDAERSQQASEYFALAGFGDIVESLVGPAEQVLATLTDQPDFLLLDNGHGNYTAAFEAIRPRLADAATVVADNVGIGAEAMADYLSDVRSRYESTTHWFDVDLPWVKRDAMEVTLFRR